MLDTYIRWVFETAVPTWRHIGFDADKAAFHERLDLDGRPLLVPQRAMTQARQIYVFSHAAALGVLPEGAAMASAAMASLRQRYGRMEGDELSFVYSIEPASGAVVSPVLDSYTHAFILLAAAFLFKATQDPGTLALADAVIRFIEARFVDARFGGVVDALPRDPQSPFKRQNPQMHLLEAYIALEQVAPGRGYLKRAMSLVALFRDKMFDLTNGVLVEHFDAQWHPHPHAQRGSFFEPGHHYEWVWLLEQAQRLSAADLSAERNALYTHARRYGHGEDGRIFDEVTINGEPKAPSHRLWPHTEAIKAAATMGRDGRSDSRGFSDAMAGVLLDTFVDRPFTGGWIDHVEPDLAPRVDYVPASSLYHLFLAATEGAPQPVQFPSSTILQPPENGK